MKLHKFLLVFGLVGASLVFLTERVRARNGTVIAQQSVSDKRDGQHDFDFLVGSWKFHLKRLVRRLAGSNEWVEFDGTTVCRKVLDGRAEVEEMNVYSADKHTYPGFGAASLQPRVPSVEHLLGQRGRWSPGAESHGRTI